MFHFPPPPPPGPTTPSKARPSTTFTQLGKALAHTTPHPTPRQPHSFSSIPASTADPGKSLPSIPTPPPTSPGPGYTLHPNTQQAQTYLSMVARWILYCFRLRLTICKVFSADVDLEAMSEEEKLVLCRAATGELAHSRFSFKQDEKRRWHRSDHARNLDVQGLHTHYRCIFIK